METAAWVAHVVLLPTPEILAPTPGENSAKIPSLQAERSSLEEFDVPGELLEETATTNLQRAELAEPRTPAWLLSFPLPLGKVFPTLSSIITWFGAPLQEGTSQLQISSFILLSAGAKPSKLQLSFGEGRKHLQLLNWLGEKKMFSSCLRTAAHFKGQEFVWVSLHCSPSLGRRNFSSSGGPWGGLCSCLPLLPSPGSRYSPSTIFWRWKQMN